MTLLTAYNQDVQRYFQGSNCTTTSKCTIFEAIEEKLFLMGQSFSKLFPNKKKMVLDEIVFLLSGKGICKIGAEKLSEKTGASVGTVYGAVKSLKETGEILVARLADGNAGKYVFVLKSHPNFKQILKEVFFIDSLPVDEQIEGLFEGQFEGLQNPESVGAVSVEEAKTSSNYINSFNLFKHESNSIIQAIENQFVNEVKTQEDETYRNEFYASENQHVVYNEINKIIVNEEIKVSATIIGLRAGSNCNVIKAVQTVIQIEWFIKGGGVVREGIPALFTMMYQHGLQMDNYEKQYRLKQQLIKPAPATKKVPFYNWLEERE